jgi:hypothetical protein
MAHWAEVDENNIVLRVIVGDDNDPAGDEGYQWIVDTFGGTWLKTSYNSAGGVHYAQDDENQTRGPSGKPHFRYNFAQIGSKYDPVKDAFIPPKPAAFKPEGFVNTIDWVLDESTYLWKQVIVKVV